MLDFRTTAPVPRFSTFEVPVSRNLEGSQLVVFLTLGRGRAEDVTGTNAHTVENWNNTIVS